MIGPARIRQDHARQAAAVDPHAPAL
jgi:hypothetical protein